MSTLTASNSETIRNNGLRRVVSSPVNETVDFIDEKLPWVTPNMITAASTAGMLALNYLSIKHPKKGFAIGVAQTAVVLGDLLDGSLARRKATNNGTKTTLGGALADSLSDKIQEVGHGLALSRRARRQGHAFSGAMHLLSGVTAPLPALARSEAESKGVIVREGGLGTRPLRATYSIVNTALLNNRPLAAGALSAFTAAQNIMTAYRRHDAANNPGSPHRIGVIEDPVQMADSGTRFRALGVVTGMAAGIAAHEFYQTKPGN